jgi:hypothetical protein
LDIFYLHGAVVEEMAFHEVGKLYCFRVRSPPPERSTIYMHANSKKDMDDWIRAILVASQIPGPTADIEREQGAPQETAAQVVLEGFRACFRWCGLHPKHLHGRRPPPPPTPLTWYALTYHVCEPDTGRQDSARPVISSVSFSILFHHVLSASRARVDSLVPINSRLPARSACFGSGEEDELWAQPFAEDRNAAAAPTGLVGWTCMDAVALGVPPSALGPHGPTSLLPNPLSAVAEEITTDMEVEGGATQSTSEDDMRISQASSTGLFEDTL